MKKIKKSIIFALFMIAILLAEIFLIGCLELDNGLIMQGSKKQPTISDFSVKKIKLDGPLGVLSLDKSWIDNKTLIVEIEVRLASHPPIGNGTINLNGTTLELGFEIIKDRLTMPAFTSFRLKYVIKNIPKKDYEIVMVYF